VELLASADAIVHAGDFTAVAVLHELEALGPPVHAVCGNVDEPALRRRLPEALEIEIAGARIGLTHDGGPRSGRIERLRAMFGEVDCVIFGHSHMPERQRAGTFQIFNPGSPTERRRAPNRSMGLLEVDRGEPVLRHVSL
jgi:uncharacterized protein